MEGVRLVQFEGRALAGERAVGGTGVELDGAPAVPGDDRAVGATPF
jgi:hypothetical protein